MALPILYATISDAVPQVCILFPAQYFLVHSIVFVTGVSADMSAVQ